MMSEPIYRWMLYRLYSFLRYPETAYFRPPQLVNMGFYSSGRGEEVTCYRCGVSHTDFQPGENIRRAHILRSPDCPLNTGGPVLEGDDASPALNVVPQVLPNPQPNRNRPTGNQSISYFSWELQIGITFRRSDPDFKLLEAVGIQLRRYTFYDWPRHQGDSKQLALLGFFYTGILDKVQCCVCGIMYKTGNFQTPSELRANGCLPCCRSNYS